MSTVLYVDPTVGNVLIPYNPRIEDLPVVGNHAHAPLFIKGLEGDLRLVSSETASAMLRDRSYSKDLSNDQWKNMLRDFAWVESSSATHWWVAPL